MGRQVEQGLHTRQDRGRVRHQEGASRHLRDDGQEGPVRQAQPEDASRVLSRPFARERRRPRRGPHVHLLQEGDRRWSDQPLDGPRPDEEAHAQELQGLHEGPHDVRDPVRDGSDRQPDHPVRHRDHRLALRRRQHEHHDPHGRRGPEAPRRRRRLHPLHPLRRRSAQEGPEGRRVAVREEDRGQVHHPVPRRAPDLVVRIGLRRERAPRQEVLRAPHRLEDGEGPGLDGRAHAHPHAHEPREEAVPRDGRVPVRLRQDQPRHDASEAPGLEAPDDRRRHRVAQAWRRRASLRHQPRERLLRRCAGNVDGLQPERAQELQEGHDLHERRPHPRRRHLVGGHGYQGPEGRHRLEGQSLLRLRRRSLPHGPEAGHDEGRDQGVGLCRGAQELALHRPRRELPRP